MPPLTKKDLLSVGLMHAGFDLCTNDSILFKGQSWNTSRRYEYSYPTFFGYRQFYCQRNPYKVVWSQKQFKWIRKSFLFLRVHMLSITYPTISLDNMLSLNQYRWVVVVPSLLHVNFVVSSVLNEHMYRLSSHLNTHSLYSKRSFQI